MKEGVVCRVNFLDSEALTIELPNFMELEIKETAPGFKGDTVSSTGKPAILETGAEVNVPLFCETGDVVRVDTRTGEYLRPGEARRISYGTNAPDSCRTGRAIGTCVCSGLVC